MTLLSDAAGTEADVEVGGADVAAAGAEEEVAVDVVSASLFHVMACC